MIEYFIMLLGTYVLLSLFLNSGFIIPVLSSLVTGMLYLSDNLKEFECFRHSHWCIFTYASFWYLFWISIIYHLMYLHIHLEIEIMLKLLYIFNP